MKKKICVLALASMFVSVPALSATIESTGYGMKYELGVLTNTIISEELGDATSVDVTQDIYSSQFVERTANVSGDLSTGEMGVSTTLIPLGQTSSVATSALLRMADTLTFDLTDQAAGGTVDIDVGVAWDGIFLPYIANRPSGASLIFGLTSEDDELSLATRADVDAFILSALNPGFQAGEPLKYGDDGYVIRNGTFSGDWAASGLPLNSFSGLFSVETGKITEIDFFIEMKVFGNADFFTPGLVFDSPVPFTSASSVFNGSNNLTPTPTPVNAPSLSYLFFATLFGYVARRRKTKRVLV
ncbi:hypothetical protein ACOI22_16250 [Glaciecola sp. 2405UD65-10]|uniref:hypothetical protein n=1 Tax=Glaciecola sp. 2405UD65-10 TaxID=3397244 RepID=UPI003B5A9EA1